MKNDFIHGTVMVCNMHEEAQNSESIQVKGRQYQLILVIHDESVFYQNDCYMTHWIANTSKATPFPKGDGQSIVVSNFLTAVTCLMRGLMGFQNLF